MGEVASIRGSATAVVTYGFHALARDVWDPIDAVWLARSVWGGSFSGSLSPHSEILRFHKKQKTGL
jgi:hypothetical protein